MLNIHWSEKFSNRILYQQSNQKEVDISIRERKWKWISHILRRFADKTIRQALEWNPQG